MWSNLVASNLFHKNLIDTMCIRATSYLDQGFSIWGMRNPSGGKRQATLLSNLCDYLPTNE